MNTKNVCIYLLLGRCFPSWIFRGQKFYLCVNGRPTLPQNWCCIRVLFLLRRYLYFSLAFCSFKVKSQFWDTFCVIFSRLETRITEKFNFVVISITEPLSFKDTFSNLDMQELNLHHKTCQHISLTCNRSQVGWIDGDSFGDKKRTDEIKINDPVVYMLINMVIRHKWLKPHSSASSFSLGNNARLDNLKSSIGNKTLF